MLYQIADFILNFENPSDIVLKFCKDYVTDAQPFITSFFISDDDAYNEENGSDTYPFGYLKYIATYRKLAEWLPLHNAFVLHSATFDVDGVGVAFAAHSGTGKTTHMNLWQQLLGDRMTVVNGDKPIVRFFEDEPDTPYAYGNPWNGKERLGCNMRTPLKHICFIERARENSVEKMEPREAIDRIFNQVYMPKDPVAVMKTIELINRLIHSSNLWKINCNMDISAAQTAYNTIFGKEK